MTIIEPILVDAEGVLRDWLNTLTTSLVGDGNPLPLGAWLDHPRPPYRGAYVHLAAGTADDNAMAGGVARHPVYGQVYANTRKQAIVAAIAYAETIRSLYIGNVPMPTDVSPTAICLGLESFRGPTWAPDTDQRPRYLVDAVLHFLPAP